MWNLLGGAIGALGSIYGAQQQSKAQEQANMLNFQLGAANLQQQAAMNEENLAQQLNFAQNSAGWTMKSDVDMAHQLGINPLSALGVGGTSFSNLVAPQNTAAGSMQAPKGLADAYSSAGQSLGRAIGAIQSPQDQAYDQATKMLALQKGQLENDMLRSQITKLNAPGQPPGVPPFSEPGVKAGVTPDAQLTATASGDVTVTPPKDIAALGFFHPASLSWYARNGLLPAFSDSYAPESQRGKDYNPFTMTYSKAGSSWYNKPFSGAERTSTVGRYLDRYHWLPGDW